MLRLRFPWIGVVVALFIAVSQLLPAGWMRTYGGYSDDLGWRVQETEDSGYIVLGSTRSFGSGDYDLWLIKTDSLGYVDAAIEEPVIETWGWKLVTSIGPQIVLRYTDRPEGFHACVFDASGRKVDEVRSASPSGTITWGGGRSRGVYFIQEIKRGSVGKVSRVILLH